ncbi:MAG: hypothetical protein SOU27_07890 [Sodaliphilus sp.]|nr:hypothetical protein [Sodaliphilus sp.]
MAKLLQIILLTYKSHSLSALFALFRALLPPWGAVTSALLPVKWLLAAKPL